MRTLASIVSVLILSALVVSCSDQATNPDVGPPALSAVGPVVHQASLGGADVCEAFGNPTGCDANFSLIANQYADGSVSGNWIDEFGQGEGGVHVKVDCLIVYGNQAVIGGVVTKSVLPGNVGTRALTTVVDNGTSANDAPDQLSFSWFGYADFVGCDYFPPELFPVFDLRNGQVRVW